MPILSILSINKVHGAYLSGVDAARRIESALRPVKRHKDILLLLQTTISTINNTNTNTTTTAAAGNKSSGSGMSSSGGYGGGAAAGGSGSGSGNTGAVLVGDVRASGLPVPILKECVFCGRSEVDDAIDGTSEAGGVLTTGKLIGPFFDPDGTSSSPSSYSSASSSSHSASSPPALFWTHENCAAFSPEVSQDNDSNWCVSVFTKGVVASLLVSDAYLCVCDVFLN